MGKIIPSLIRMKYRALMNEVSEDWEFVSDITPETDESGSYFQVSLADWNLCFKMYIEQDGKKTT